ncbi:MAG: CapA family protein [Lagierella massiliensis]|nr:CapA family protein [Lagierella massiliensis]
MKKFFKLTLAFVLLLNLASCNFNESKNISKEIPVTENNTQSNINESTEKKDEYSEITFGVTGDIMYHPWTFYKNIDENGNYDFSYFYEDVEDLIGGFHLMAGNFESTSTPKRQMEGYPMFNTPANSISTLKNSGFDILTTANNHCLDSRVNGINDTIDAIKSNDIHQTGTFKLGERPLLIVEEKGIKIGILAYTQRFNGMETILSQEQREMINPMDPVIMEKDVKEIRNKVDFLIVFPHWGEEYMFTPTEFQRNMGKNLLNWGADVVIGSHPHVIQPIEEVDVNGVKKYIFYSMGNSISGQRQEYNGLREVEAGLIANLKIKKELNDEITTLEKIELYPTWVKIDKSTGNVRAKVTAIKDYKEGGKLRTSVDENTKQRILDIENRSVEILESMGYETGLRGN